MRNCWFPRSTAAYITPAELRELKTQDVTIERDHMFAVENPEAEQEEEGEALPEVREIAKPKPIEVVRISVRGSQSMAWEIIICAQFLGLEQIETFNC